MRGTWIFVANGTPLSYVIDGEHRRIGKTINGILVQGFLYENQLEPVVEVFEIEKMGITRAVVCGGGFW